MLTGYLFIFYVPKPSSCCMRKIIRAAVLFSSDAKSAFLSFNVSKVIKLIIFNSQVISTYELVNRDIKKLYFRLTQMMWIKIFHAGAPHATLLYSVVLARAQQKSFSRHIPLWTLFLKTCLIVLYEMLHSFGHPSVKHD